MKPKSDPKFCTILSGLPGSGKSTYAKVSIPYVAVSADDFFYERGNGVYDFDPALLGEAHKECFRRFLSLLEAGENVVVDNTNLSVYEISPYYLAAESMGYNVCVIRIDCPPKVAAERNVHGVHPVQIGLMSARMNEPLPPWWNVRVVKV